MQKWVSGLFVLLAISVAGCATKNNVHTQQRPSGLPTTVIRQWTDIGICKLLWADGPAIINGNGHVIWRLDGKGRLKSTVRNTSGWVLCDPQSIHSKNAIVIGIFFRGPYRPSGSIESWDGLIDLRTNQCMRLTSDTMDASITVLNELAYSAQFWSPDYKSFLVRPRRQMNNDGHMNTQLSLINANTQGITKWTPPNGGYAISWLWSGGNNGNFNVLVGHPGCLYSLGKEAKSLRIPALDKAATAMLSPQLDRAIVFRRLCSEGCLVNFSKPMAAHPIAIPGHDDISDLILGWGSWSPDGKSVALLLADNTPKRHFEMYVGDPARTLKQVHLPRGLRFGGDFWEPQDVLVGLGSFVWSDDGKSIYCLTTKSTETSEVFHYALLKVDPR